jgi:hypothetical protein
MKGKPIAWTTPSDVSSVETDGQDNNTRPRSAPREPVYERQDNNTRLRSAPREPVSSSTTIPVAVPITQEDDPTTTPISRRRSARIQSRNPTESLTRSQSERRWRIFTRGLTQSEETQAWRDHVRQFYAEQEAKLKMAEEAKSKKQ